MCLIVSTEQRELETDEAVQRAAEAMVPNPIYSGSPIYEEIFDSTYLLRSIRNGVGMSEAIPLDDYGVKSADAANSYPSQDESKLMGEKFANFTVSSYLSMKTMLESQHPLVC